MWGQKKQHTRTLTRTHCMYHKLLDPKGTEIKQHTNKMLLMFLNLTEATMRQRGRTPRRENKSAGWHKMG